MIPMPQRISTVLASQRGVTLAQTLDNYYVVGLDYLPGQLVMTWDPRTEYFGSRSLEEARAKYLEYIGATPRTGLPIATEDNERSPS